MLCGLDMIDDPLSRLSEIELSNSRSRAAFCVVPVSAPPTTRRQSPTEAISEIDLRYRALVEVSREAILILQKNRCVLANRAAVSLLRANELEALVGQTVKKIFDSKCSPVVAYCLQQAGKGKTKPLIEPFELCFEGEIVQLKGEITVITYETKPAIQLILREIPIPRRSDEERDATIQFLRLVNASSNTGELIRSAMEFFQQQSGCEAIGLRLRRGEDYPYYRATGYPEKFLEAENSLCVRGADGCNVRDSRGRPALECLCGLVINGQLEMLGSAVTSNGSFWTNGSSQLVASMSSKIRKALRGRCVSAGYESLALIPLKAGTERLGLLQLVDKRPGRFSIEIVSSWECMAAQFSIALAKCLAEDGRREVEVALRHSEHQYRSLFSHMSEGFALHQIIFNSRGEPSDFRLLDFNPAFTRLTGFKREAVLGKTLRQYFPQCESWWIHTFGQVALTGESVHFERYFSGIDKHLDIFAYCPGAGQVATVMCDVTARRRAEELFRRHREHLQLVVESAGLGSFEFDLQTRLLTCSGRTRSHLGLPVDRNPSAEELLLAVHPRDRLRIREWAKEILRPVGDGQYSARFRTVPSKGGLSRRLCVCGRVIFDPQGRPERLIGAVFEAVGRRSHGKGLGHSEAAKVTAEAAFISGFNIDSP